MAGRSVLIVDDNELNLRLAETVLNHAGFDVHVARNAAEARDRLAERQWSAVLMDLRLPDGNGLELYRDRPEAEWPRTPEGELAMHTRRLDLQSLLAEKAPA